MNRLCLCCLLLMVASPVSAATLRVPDDHRSIQAAIEAAGSGDTILVAPGKYAQRLRLKPGLTLRSAGDDTAGKTGLTRAEATILDGSGPDADEPGVVMAEGSTLDGFTITGVGAYDDALWNKHHASQGEELGDEEGSVQAEGTHPAISIRGVTCTVTHCIVHHNGDVGIGILGQEKTKTTPLITANTVYRNMGGGIGAAEGAEAIIRGNRCYENLRAGIGCRAASPIIADNVCHHNIRAGIGCREGSQPVIRNNQCYQNRRAGIGIRMEGTAPVVERNECFENLMAGIGCRDGASPIVRNNDCHHNQMAGIGARDGAQPLIVGNECRENEMAGIGLQGKATATIQGNHCLENKLVAIGITGESQATILDNDLARTGGVPPLVAIKDGSQATLQNNRLNGGGVAAILVQGNATIRGNQFTGAGEKQGTAVWVWEGSKAQVTQNDFARYRTAVNATKSDLLVIQNSIRGFQGAPIVLKESSTTPIVQANTIFSKDPQAKIVDFHGGAGVEAANVVKAE